MRALTALLILSLTLSISLSTVVVVCSESEAINNARNEIQLGYKAVMEAYEAGGDISELAKKLNEALNLTSKAEETVDVDPEGAERLTSEAQTLARSVIETAPIIKEEGLKQRQTTIIIVTTSAAALIIVGVLIYLSGPKHLWKMWLRLRKNYRVRVRHSSTSNNGPIITIEEVCALILALIIIISVFAASQVFFPRGIAEPFSELGVLGPNMKIGDYPKEIVAGETIKLYIYVGNQMGKPVYYLVMVKLGDNRTSVNPAPNKSILQFERVLLQNGTWIFPAYITLTEASLNQRIIFELWMYNETSNQNQYHERWGQVWINVTAPPI